MAGDTFVYDDDCGFCTWWADFFGRHSDLHVVAFSDVDASLRERLPADWEDCAHLVTDERVHSCGAAIEEAWLRTDVGSLTRPVADPIGRLGPYRALREWGYRRAANNRPLLSKVLSKRPPVSGDDRRGRDRE